MGYDNHALDELIATTMPKALRAMNNLFEACRQQGTDSFGFVHYIEKEIIEDAQREVGELERAFTKWKKSKNI